MPTYINLTNICITWYVSYYTDILTEYNNKDFIPSVIPHNWNKRITIMLHLNIHYRNNISLYLIYRFILYHLDIHYRNNIAQLSLDTFIGD